MIDFVRIHRSKFSTNTLNVFTINNQPYVGDNYVSVFAFSKLVMVAPANVPVIDNITATNLIIANNLTLFKLDLSNYTLQNS